MDEILTVWNGSVPSIRNLQLALVFDVFQFLVILVSLCAGLILLFLLPVVKKKNYLTLWLLILYGFLHEFYSVIVLITLKFSLKPNEVCMDSHYTSLLVTAFIFGTILTSALQTETVSAVFRILIWIYILCCATFLVNPKVGEKFSHNANQEVNPTLKMYLTLCGANVQQSRLVLYDYLIFYIPVLIITISLRRQQLKNDFQFWNIRILPKCSSDGYCRKCSRCNDAVQILFLYLSTAVYILRPLAIVYHQMTGGPYYDVTTCVFVMGTYCYLCVESFENFGKCKFQSSKFEI